MELKVLARRAMEIKEKYHQLEERVSGKRWTNSQIMEGFVVDVGELMQIIMAKEGLRKMENIDQQLGHELADCLFSVLVLSEKYGVDLEKSFLDTMQDLEKRIEKM